MDFSHRTAIVTGAAKGIGFAVSQLIASHGGDVALVDLDPESLELAKARLSGLGVRVLSYVCDVADEGRVRSVVKDAIQQLEKIDILVNNAGVYRTHVLPFLESKSDFWREKINVNILGTMYFTHAVLRNMLQNHYGRIINLGSVAGYYGKAGMADYSMSKGAIAAFTKALAKEVTGEGVLVNTVSPGTIATEASTHPFSFVGRSGTPEECAALICFLASEEASYISGQEYLVDGLRRQM